MRTETFTSETRVTYVARPRGKARKTGPHLADLRAFVAECEGMPGDVLVHIEKGHMSEGGRYNVTLTARQTTTAGAASEAEDVAEVDQ